MVSQTCADTEPVTFLFKNASVIFGKKLELGTDDTTDPRNPDIAAVQMTGKRQIRSPLPCKPEKTSGCGPASTVSIPDSFLTQLSLSALLLMELSG